MATTSRKRARADADKLTRRHDIVLAATQAFAEGSLSSVTMADVARRAGLAKGTVYLYFPGKEALFLHLVTDALAGWFQVIEAELQRTSAELTADALAALLVRTLVADPALTRLMTLLPTLEENVDEELIVAFKRRLRDQVIAAGILLERRFPAFAPFDGARFLLHFNAVVLGVHAMASPPPAALRAMQQPDLAPLQIDFAAEVLLVIAGLLRGWRPRTGQESHVARLPLEALETD